MTTTVHSTQQDEGTQLVLRNALLGSKRNQIIHGVGPQVIHVLQEKPLVYAGRSKFAAFSTCRRKTEGRMSRAVQMSKMERRDGLVFPSSIRLMKARSYPAFAARAS